jgi:hypothetical protein
MVTAGLSHCKYSKTCHHFLSKMTRDPGASAVVSKPALGSKRTRFTNRHLARFAGPLFGLQEHRGQLRITSVRSHLAGSLSGVKMVVAVVVCVGG